VWLNCCSTHSTLPSPNLRTSLAATVNVKWGREKFTLDLDPTESPETLKAQLFGLTQVRQSSPPLADGRSHWGSSLISLRMACLSVCLRVCVCVCVCVLASISFRCTFSPLVSSHLFFPGVAGATKGHVQRQGHWGNSPPYQPPQVHCARLGVLCFTDPGVR
jgi:hypothetical protein